MSSIEPIRWGVLGCASIFERRMAPAFTQAVNARLLGLASRARDRAEACAARHGIERAYGSYEELLADPDIEAVYIPLPNDLHVEWTQRSLDAGKHVLCDKPSALTYADAKRVAEQAERAGLRLLEGFMWRYHPQHARVQEIIAGGEMGSPVHFRGAFSFPADERHRQTFRFQRGGGGAS
jgi:predicted dehydrogenase